MRELMKKLKLTIPLISYYLILDQDFHFGDSKNININVQSAKSKLQKEIVVILLA